jgi:hypothetical protein
MTGLRVLGYSITATLHFSQESSTEAGALHLIVPGDVVEVLVRLAGWTKHSLQARSRVAEDISGGATHRWVCIPSQIAALRFLSPKPGVLFVREAFKALEKFFRQARASLRGQLQSFDFEFIGAHGSTILRRAPMGRATTPLCRFLYRFCGFWAWFAVSNPVEIRTRVAAFERGWWLRLGCVDLLRNDTLCTRLAKNHSDFECFRERETTLNLRVVGSIPTRLTILDKALSSSR